MENSSNLNGTKALIFSGALVVLLLIVAFIARVFFFTFVDSSNVAYEYNKSDGAITVLPRTGYFRVTPWVTEVHEIDTRPMQVRIEANNRVLNAKLVQFRGTQEGVLQFVQMHGRQDYTQNSLADILKSYAYEGYGSSSYSEEFLEKKYKFLDILGATSSAMDSTTTPTPKSTKK